MLAALKAGLLKNSSRTVQRVLSARRYVTVFFITIGFVGCATARARIASVHLDQTFQRHERPGSKHNKDLRWQHPGGFHYLECFSSR